MSIQNKGVDASGLLSAASALSKPAEDIGNDSRVEALWAIKAMEHSQVYFNILCSVAPSHLPRLSPCDDEISEAFRKKFPRFAVDVIQEEHLKSTQAKKEWREFCDSFRHVEDFSFATLLRLDASKDYSEENSIIVTKIQFYAIELARNKEGHNDSVRGNFKPTPRGKRRGVTTTTTAASAGAGQTATTTGSGQRPIVSEVERELQQIIGGQHSLLQ